MGILQNVNPADAAVVSCQQHIQRSNNQPWMEAGAEVGSDEVWFCVCVCVWVRAHTHTTGSGFLLPRC